MSQYTDTYILGATQLVVATGISLIYQVTPGRCVNGGFFKNSTAAATLAIVSGPGVTFSNGYVLGSNEVVQFQGPATFFLAASGATASVMFVQSLNMGFSQLP